MQRAAVLEEIVHKEIAAIERAFGGAVLAMSAAAMQQWSSEDAAITHAGESDAL